MEYNTQQRKLPLPEYGRSVQHMVENGIFLMDVQMVSYYHMLLDTMVLFQLN